MAVDDRVRDVLPRKRRDYGRCLHADRDRNTSDVVGALLARYGRALGAV